LTELEAVSDPDPSNSITFANGITVITLQTALPPIGHNVDISAAGEMVNINRATAVGTPEFGVLEIIGGNADLTNIAVYNGRASNAGGIYVGGGAVVSLDNCAVDGNVATASGGGLVNEGTLYLENSYVTYNQVTTGNGGGIWNSGSLWISNCQISMNNAGSDGGGIYNNGDEATVNIDDWSIMDGNIAVHDGGAILNPATLYMSSCELTDNQAGNQGGGLHCAGMGSYAEITGSSFYSNSANYGGGLYVAGQVYLTNTTVEVNDGSILGGGVFVAEFGFLELTMECTLTGNTAGGGNASGGGFVAENGYFFFDESCTVQSEIEYE
jgi:hypothetical protein